MNGSIGVWEAMASFTLVALVVAISLWRRLGLERSIIWAATRATVQLLVVGAIFTAMFTSDLADLWAWGWVVAMVIMSGFVVRKRAPRVPFILPTGIAAIAMTATIVLLVVFGLQILEPDPVAIVVISGITIGNTMPSVVLGADRMLAALDNDRGQVEALLALGCNRDQATIHVVKEVIRSALIPQIERTKVVGIVALPGAMTGLLLAGVDPVDAVILQLMVMFLVLGAVATSVVIVTGSIARRSLTDDLRIADWLLPTTS